MAARATKQVLGARRGGDWARGNEGGRLARIVNRREAFRFTVLASVWCCPWDR